jgi:hypothetical protein
MLRQLEQQRAAHMLAREWLTMPPWVVCTRGGTPMDESKVRRAMRTVLLAAGLPQHFSPHVCGIPMRVSCCNRANP